MKCFISAGIAKENLQAVFREVLPMALLMIGVLLMITYIPPLITVIPNMVMG